MMKVVVLIAVLLFNLSAEDTLLVDLDKTKIQWIGRKITGEHHGTIDLSDGWVVLEKNKIIDGKLIFDMASISNTDIESPEYRQKLENHLKSEDFFHVDSFPQAILKINGSQSLSIESSVNNNQILASLTIKGITQEISFPISIQQTVFIFSTEGTVDIDRTLYNIQYKSGKFFEDLGDRMIYDIFSVQFFVYTEAIQTR